MLYKFLALVSDFIPMAIAVAGIIMSYKQPPKESHLKTTLILLGVGFVGTGVLSWTRTHNEDVHAQEVASQKTAIQNLQQKLDQTENDRAQAEIKHAGEQKFVEGELQVFKQVGPAVLKLAQVAEENIRKQYEAKMLSNQELYDATMEVVRKLREFAHKRAMQSAQQMNQEMAAMQAAKTDSERQKIWQEQANKMTAAYYQTDAEFRSSVLPDAIYVRNELRRRKVPEPPPAGPFQSRQMIDSVFAGSLAGAYPELDAADYLEQMAKQLRLK